MYQSYIKIGWRNLIKNKGYAFINIDGLAMGYGHRSKTNFRNPLLVTDFTRSLKKPVKPA